MPLTYGVIGFDTISLRSRARERLQPLAEGTLLRLAEQAQKQPFGLANLVAALDLWQHGLVTTIIVDGADGAGQGDGLSAQAEALRAAASSLYLPDHFVWVSRPGQVLPPDLASLTAGKTAQGGRATAYVCVGTRCTAPITDAAELTARLKEKP